MKAVKGNKVYTIDETQKRFYEDSGFDILDDEGTVIAYGKGKTVPFGEFIALKQRGEELEAENETLKKQLEDLKKAGGSAKAAAEKKGAEAKG